jgi:hypothetical protein
MDPVEYALKISDPKMLDTIRSTRVNARKDRARLLDGSRAGPRLKRKATNAIELSAAMAQTTITVVVGISPNTQVKPTRVAEQTAWQAFSAMLTA